MPDYSAGTAYLQIVPTLLGDRASIQRQLDDALAGTDKRVQVEVDADAGAARAELSEVGAQADELGRKRETVKVDVDGAARATAELRAVGDEAERTGRRSSESKGSVLSLMQAGVLLGPSIIPIAGAAAAALGAMGTGAIAGGVGMGVLRLATSGVGDAVKKLGAAHEATGKQAVAANKAAQQALEGLTPPARSFALYLASLKPRFDELQRTAARGLFPGVEAGLRSLMGEFPVFRGIIANVARAMGDLARDAGRALNDPFWHGFFEYIRNTAGPALLTMGRTFGNVFRGMAGLIQATSPLFFTIAGAVENLARRFAAFGTSAAGGTNSGFNAFLGYVRANGPLVAQTLRDLVEAAARILLALRPMGGTVLTVVDALARFVNIIPPSVLAPIAVGVYSIFTAWKAVSTVKAGVEGVTGAIKFLGEWSEKLRLRTIATTIAQYAQAAAMGVVRGAAAVASGVMSLLSGAVSAVRDASILSTIAQYAQAAAMGVVRGATLLWTGVQWALNAALTANPIGIVIVVIGLLVAAVIYAYTHFQTFRDIVDAVWSGIKSATMAVVDWFSGPFVGFWTGLGQWFSNLWHGIGQFFSDTWNWIRNTAVGIWDAISSFFVAAFAAYVALFSAVWHGIGQLFSDIWNSMSQAGISIWNGLAAFFGGAFSAFTSFFRNTWNGIVRIFTDAWNGIKAAGVNIWRGIQDVFRSGVNGVIDAVNWMVDKINAVLKLLSIPTIPLLARMEAGGIVPMMEAGGQVPMYASGTQRIGGGFTTNRPTAIVGEGGPHPEYVIPTDPKYRDRALRLYQGLGDQLMADGGVLGWIGGTASSIWNGVTGAASSIGTGINDLIGWFTDGAGGMVSKLIDAVKGMIGNPFFSGIAGGLAKMIGGGLSKMFMTASNVPGVGVQRWAPIALQALALAHAPAAWLPLLLAQMQTESGGNPGIFNTTDINAQRGTPSGGLMQVIGPTFAAYAGPLRGLGLLNPLANIYAAIEYTIARYGSPVGVWGRGHGYASGGVLGYDSGGYLPPGLTTVFNGTGRPEPVLTPAQLNSVSSGGGKFVGTLTLDSGAFIGQVEGVINQANADQARALSGGRRV